MTHDQLVRLLTIQACQIAILTGVIAIVLKFPAHRRPWLAHGLWLVVLIKCVTPPLLSHPLGIFCYGQELLAATDSEINVESLTMQVA